MSPLKTVPENSSAGPLALDGADALRNGDGPTGEDVTNEIPPLYKATKKKKKKQKKKRKRNFKNITKLVKHAKEQCKAN
jgi:hypothetical protein